MPIRSSIQRKKPLRQTFRETENNPTVLRPFRSPKGMISRGVQALSGFLSSFSSQYFLDIEGRIQNERLVDTLKDFLFFQQKADALYSRAMDQFSRRDEEKDIQRYWNQVKHHISLYEGAIRDLHGNLETATPRRAAYKQWFDGFFKRENDRDFQDISILENLFIVESLHLQAYETVNEVIPFCEDSATKDRLQNLVDELENEEKEQNQWVRRCLTRQILKNLVLPVEMRQAA